jgi:hypothetical protein
MTRPRDQKVNHLLSFLVYALPVAAAALLFALRS